MKHYIWHPMNWGEKPYDPAWVARRADIYRRYVRPQLAQQTRRDVETVLYIKRDMTAAVDAFAGLVDHMVAIDRDGLASPDMWAARDGQPVLWTRLDTDDLLSVDSVALIQDAAARFPETGGALLFGPPNYWHAPQAGTWSRWTLPQPPCSTIVIPPHIWAEPHAAREYAWTKHNQVKQRFPYWWLLPPGRFCALLHGANQVSRHGRQFVPDAQELATLRQRFPVLFTEPAP